jgi:hypothetical protein
MARPVFNTSISKIFWSARRLTLAVILLCAVRHGLAQDVPFISGGGGFFTTTNAGQTSYLPILAPVLAVPIGSHLLVESRGVLLESIAPGANGVYDHSHFASLTYLQGDYVVSPHLTVVGGSFLLPFGTYNERLSPIWISNFQDGPLISGLGIMSTGIGTGGMLRGSAISRRKYSIDYATYFSSRVGNQYFSAKRSSGGRASLYLPEQRLEIGFSYDRLLQGTHENFYGMHVWWEPKDTAFRLRSEFARGHHAQGYWVEGDYRLQKFGGLDSWIGRIEPLIRMQQTFRRDTLFNDSLPLVNTQRVDFGLDYNLPHNTRVLTSYARQFSSTGNENVWETGVVYRFLFPTWKGKQQ